MSAMGEGKRLVVGGGGGGGGGLGEGCRSGHAWEEEMDLSTYQQESNTDMDERKRKTLQVGKLTNFQLDCLILMFISSR